jgi:hypothetical protein
MISSERVVELLLERCPELKAMYEDYFRVERDNPYVIFGCVVVPQILSIAESGTPEDKEQLERLMAVLEEIATTGDTWSSDLIEVGVLESLVGERQWGELKGLMGSATRRLAEHLEQGES